MAGLTEEAGLLVNALGRHPAHPIGGQAAAGGNAAPTPPTQRVREHLLLQMQPSRGPHQQRECLSPPSATSLVFGYLGDLQLRFVFDAPGVGSATLARTEDFARLDLSPARAMAQAMANFKRMGAPEVVSMGGGVYSLRAQHPAYSALHMLDRSFWRAQLRRFPQGLIAALPRKGMLMFAPAGDPAIERALTQQASRIVAQSGPGATSSWLYRFDAGGWTPVADLTRAPAATNAAARLPVPAAASVHDDAPREDDGAAGDDDDDVVIDDDLDLDKAAQGQKMLIWSILGGIALNGVLRTGIPAPLAMLLVLALGIFSLLGVVRLCSGLGKPTNFTIICMVLAFVPLLSLVSWIVLSVQATRRLRAAGFKVGLFGARA